VTVDEELDRLEEGIRRLKIEYEVYFNGGAPVLLATRSTGLKS